jgi:hypothetical protein
MRARKWILAGAAGLLIAIAVIGALVVGRRFAEPAKAPVALALPRAGETRADYLPDGTPVWVVGHQDGSVDVFSAFSTHPTFGVQNLTWWCPASRAIEDPFSGSGWTEYGVKVAGPAPSDLARWSTAVHGDKVLVGDLTSGAPARLATGQQQCTADDDVTVHSFDDWRRWDSPRRAIASEPGGWILLAGALAPENDASVAICSLTGCEDSAIPDGVGPLRTSLRQFDGLPDQLFIVKVRGGRLTELTRVVVLNSK